jgi:outer membrane protein, heavy metal efflux system
VSARVLILAGLLMASLHAQEKPLVLQEMVREALAQNREIAVAQKRYEALLQRPAQEGALPDPMISLGYNSSGSPLPFQGIGREPVANTGVMITQELPYPAKRRLRGDIARKEAEAGLQQLQTVQRNVVFRLKQAYVQLQHNYEQRSVIERSRDLLRQLLKTAEIRYAAGRAMQQDVFKSQTQLSILEGRLTQLERGRRTLEAQINALLNRLPDEPLGRPEEPHAAPLVQTLEQIQVFARDHAPMLRRGEKMIQKSDLAYNLARKDFYPDLAFSGGYFYMGAMPDMYMFRADLKLPLFGKRQALTEQAQIAAESRRGYEANARNLQARIQEDYLAAVTATQLMELYTGTVIPQARLALESSLRSYETGSLDFTGVLGNYLVSVEYEMNFHEEMQNYHLALARLEEMTGMELLP